MMFGQNGTAKSRGVIGCTWRSAASLATLATALAMTAAVDSARAESQAATNAPAADAAIQTAPSASTKGVDVADAAAPAYTVDAVNAAIGTNPIERFFKYHIAELGQAGPPTDPKAPPAIRKDWPAVPQTTPPMPFTDWPYGGTTLIGDNRTASVDSPLMVAIADTGLGKAISSTGIQAYGWIDYGGNISTSKSKGGNSPAAYDYNPNSITLDQAVIYVERTPDTVQTDHIDWGFRLSAIAGENYRYTTAYGVASYQLLKDNHYYGYDFPMVYGELWIPNVAEGLMIRAGRYISLPDIEAQLAPNNYMYTHSITYTLDNYTNTGIQTTLAVTKQIMLQVGISDGTEAALWHVGQKLRNQFPNNAADLVVANNYLTANGLAPVTNANPLYPGATYLRDPGAKPSYTLCARFQSMGGQDDLNLCANGINNGTYGYNNLQWYGLTYYHIFNAHWHISAEVYNEHENGVPNINNPLVANVIIPNGGAPFSPQNIPFNAPNAAQCNNAIVYKCRATAIGAVDYLNWSPNPLNNVSLRTEYYDDEQGQRTGFAAVYYEVGLGWQHWLSPQIELRPEFTWYHSSKTAFNNASQAETQVGTPRKDERVLSGDIIVHF
jgi:hypothetical protein